MASVVKKIGGLLKTVFSKIFALIKGMVDNSRERRNAQKASAEPQKMTAVLQNTPQAETKPQQSPKSGTSSESDVPGSYVDQLPARPVWVLPNPEEILDPAVEPPDDTENDRHRARVIEETLQSFGAPAHVVEIRRGPTITLFGVEPDFVETRNGKTRVHVSKITSLADDLALALAASRIRIQAPVPGKGYIGIEVPNQKISLVSLHEVISNPAYINLEFASENRLGKGCGGENRCRRHDCNATLIDCRDNRRWQIRLYQ